MGKYEPFDHIHIKEFQKNLIIGNTFEVLWEYDSSTGTYRKHGIGTLERFEPCRYQGEHGSCYKCPGYLIFGDLPGQESCPFCHGYGTKKAVNYLRFCQSLLPEELFDI